MSPQSCRIQELCSYPSVAGGLCPRAFICTRTSSLSACIWRVLVPVVITKKSMIGVTPVKSSTTVSLPRYSSHSLAMWQASSRLRCNRFFEPGVETAAEIADSKVRFAGMVVQSLVRGNPIRLESKHHCASSFWINQLNRQGVVVRGSPKSRQIQPRKSINPILSHLRQSGQFPTQQPSPAMPVPVLCHAGRRHSIRTRGQQFRQAAGFHEVQPQG